MTIDAGITLQLLGAGGFGAIVGWFIYYVNRYRRGDVQFSDLTTLVGAIGGAAILALFPVGTSLFGAYGIGLFVGFFSYFLSLCILVFKSRNFDADFFLDGRRKRPSGDEYIPGGFEPGGGQHPVLANPGREGQIVVVIPPEAIKIPVVPTSYTACAGARTLVAADVIKVCEQVWSDSQTDGNAFVKAVAGGFNVAFTGQADDIMEQIKGPDWTSHDNDGIAASNAAKSGRLVIGGMTSADLGQSRGHVVVVVAPTGPLAHGKYPYAYWGSLNPKIRPDGGAGKTINYSFDSDHQDQVFYASREIDRC
jgi:hypothetical protein